MNISSLGITTPIINAGSSNTQAANPFANLDLTTAQQGQSPAQQQTLAADLQSAKHSGHHHHHGGGGESSAATDVLSPGFGQTDQSDSTASSATVNGLSIADLQSQVLAGNVISQSQLQNQLLQFGSVSA